MIKDLGFSGTKAGMTPKQAIAVIRLLERFKPQRVHHGDCIGSDAQFHTLATLVGAQRYIHPPIDTKHRAYCVGEHMEQPAAYLVRNHRIVGASELLIATPAQTKEMQRSGTWATIRRANSSDLPVYIVFPDGQFDVL